MNRIAELRAAFEAKARIQAWHLLPVSRADARQIAILAAHTLGAHHSYVPNDGTEFEPHEWVVAAILRAANMRSSKDGQWETVTPKTGAEPRFECPEHLYQVHPEDAHLDVAAIQPQDVREIVDFIFQHFGTHWMADQLPEHIVTAVRRVEKALGEP